MERRCSAHSSVLLAAAASRWGRWWQLGPGRYPPQRCAGGSPGASAPQRVGTPELLCGSAPRPL